MPVYDSTFIFNPQLEEAGLDARVKELVELVTRHGGKVINENRIGMRRLAYEIQKLTQGYYVSLVFEGSSAVVTELERDLRLDENCLRFLTCHYQDFSRRRRHPDPGARAQKRALEEEADVKSKAVPGAEVSGEGPPIDDMLEEL